MNTHPLCVDLDGTLLKTDSLWESIIHAFKIHPWSLFLIAYWLTRGKAHMKRNIAKRYALPTQTIPAREDVVRFVIEQKNQGRTVVLATGADRDVAESVAARWPQLFSRIMASDGAINLTSTRKKDALVSAFGERGFDYIGNEKSDLAVWKHARAALMVRPTERMVRALDGVTPVEKIFSSSVSYPLLFFREMRTIQWSKNTLIFLPIFLSHQVGNFVFWWQSLLAFASFCLAASGMYIVNDLFDMAFDRQHDRKRNRPFASGDLPLWIGIVAAPLFLIGALALGGIVNAHFFALVLGYLLLAFAYSSALKKVPVMDVLVLASLYCMRIFAGGLATGISISPWLVTFSLFLFLSLAFAKRCLELGREHVKDRGEVPGRGYVVRDLPQLSLFGTTCGYMAILIFILYISSQEVLILYDRPVFLWFLFPVFFYWISRFWFLVGRNEIEDDPVLFALKDGVSYGILLLTLAISFAATRP